MGKTYNFRKASIKVYHGYGHKNDLVLYGHVFKNQPVLRRKYTNNILSNIFHLLKLFLVNPLAKVKLQLQWGLQIIESVSEADGFFKFEWASDETVMAGWHEVTVYAVNETGQTGLTGTGKIFVPHITQYAFISDIDDTVMVSYSATIWRRLRALFTKNPQSRKAFADVVNHYQLLAKAHTTDEVPNPFFYVSSSEWNLYNDLVDFFRYKNLPEGTFLLSQIKRWNQLLKSGKTKHEGKLIRVFRILSTFPRQKFVLFGDNSQADPAIYEKIATRNPEKIYAVYIRNIVKENAPATLQLLRSIEQKGIITCMFTDDLIAIAHSKKIGLII